MMETTIQPAMLQQAIKKTRRASLRSIVKTLLIYAAAVVLASVIKKRLNMLDLVLFCKIVSLGMVAGSGFKIIRTIEPDEHFIRRANWGIFIITCLLAFIFFADFAKMPISGSDLSDGVQHVYYLGNKFSLWLSAAPLILYAALDFYIRANSDSVKEKVSNLMYLFFVDATSLLPFIVVLGVVYWYNDDSVLSGGQNVKLFVSGSMALLLLSHSIAARVVEIFIKHMFEDPETAPFKLDSEEIPGDVAGQTVE